MRGISWKLDCHVLRYKGCSPGAMHRNQNFCVRFKDPVRPILPFYDASKDLQSPNPTKLRTFTFELQKGTNEVRKITTSYETVTKQLQKVTTSYEN